MAPERDSESIVQGSSPGSALLPRPGVVPVKPTVLLLRFCCLMLAVQSVPGRVAHVAGGRAGAVGLGSRVRPSAGGCVTAS